LATELWEELPAERPRPTLVGHTAIAFPAGEALVVARTDETQLLAVIGNRILRIPTTGVPPFAHGGRRRNGDARDDAVRMPFTAAVLDGNRLFVFGDRHTMSVSTIELEKKPPEWRVLEGTAQFVPVSNYALCMGSRGISLHGGVTSHNTVENSLYAVEVFGPQQKRKLSTATSVRLEKLVMDAETQDSDRSDW
jgi:hypothetical protein